MCLARVHEVCIGHGGTHQNGFERALLRTLNDALAADTEQLWLQTSEGPRGTPGKTQVVATFLSVERADPDDAHPKAKPVDCS